MCLWKTLRNEVNGDDATLCLQGSASPTSSFSTSATSKRMRTACPTDVHCLSNLDKNAHNFTRHDGANTSTSLSRYFTAWKSSNCTGFQGLCNNVYCKSTRPFAVYIRMFLPRNASLAHWMSFTTSPTHACANIRHQTVVWSSHTIQWCVTLNTFACENSGTKWCVHVHPRMRTHWDTALQGLLPIYSTPWQV